MASDASLDERLGSLQERWESITEVPEQPRSVMNVIEYGLGEQRQAEVYVNRLVRYLLAPDEPHGMGTDFLRAFLEGLPETCGFTEDIYDLSDVVVDDQVSVRSNARSKADEESQGWLDLLIQVPNEWFLIVELKFSAAETGTSFYCEADSVDGRSKQAYESGEYYVYLHQADEPEASGDCFVNWTWEDFLADVIEPFLLQHGPRYPQRTVNQLREFAYDIREITGMTEFTQSEQEKAALYIEYFDAVNDVSDAFENKWEEFTEEWYRRLNNRIDDETITNNWIFYEHNTDWAFIFKREWWRRIDTFEPVTQPTDPRRVRVGFLHRLEKNRDLAVGEKTLKFQFRNTPPNRYLETEDTNFRDLFVQKFNNREAEIARLLPERATLTGNMHNQIEAEYDIPVSKSDDFYTAYITALYTAYSEHVIENPELVSVIDDIYHETLETFK